jgi:dienelactone hydrolase
MAENRWGAVKVAVYLLLGLLLVLMIAGLRQANSGLQRARAQVETIPVEIFAPLEGSEKRPAVIIAHGFANSRQFMYALARSIALNGYVVAVFDFSGHGRNAATFAQSSALDRDLELVIDYVKQQPSVDAERLALLGYSMGTGVVSRYAREHPEIQTTISISGIFSEVEPGRPRNPLWLTGAWETARLKELALAALEAAGGGAASQTSGDAQSGDARRLVFIPAAEHVSMPFRPATWREVVNWLDAVLGQSSSGTFDSRLPWLAALCIVALLLFAPLARLLLSVAPAEREPGSSLELFGVLIVSGLPAVLTPLLLRVLPYGFLPLSVGDYVVTFFLLQGVLMIALLFISGVWNGATLWRQLSPRALIAALLCFGYLAVTCGIAIDGNVLNLWPVARRIPLIVISFICLAPYFLASEYIARTDFPGLGRFFPLLTGGLLVLSLAAGLLLGAPFVIVLFLPVLAPLLVLCGLLNRVLYRESGHTAAGGWLTALIFAWLIGTIFPMV